MQRRRLHHVLGALATATAAGALATPAAATGDTQPARTEVVATAAAARNPQTAGLQVALRAYGLYRGPVDALAGPLTVAAVRSFQRAAGIPVTGRADVRTRSALGPVGGPLLGRRALKLRMFGWDVAVLQFLLAERGLSHGPVDGWFDRPTLLGVRRFQREAGLEPDGVVGRASLAALAQRLVVPLARPITGAPGAAAPREAPATTIRDLIDRTARRRGVDLHLARALAWVESGYQPGVVSPVGARGVMQVLPSTAKWVEEVLLQRAAPAGAPGNVLVGVVYLRYLLDEFAGDRALAVAAWLQGPASVRRDGVQPETRPFVEAVLDLSGRI